MSTEKMREEFKAWHSDQVARLLEHGEPTAAKVWSDFESLLWSTWEASRAAIEIKEPDDFTKGGNQNARILIAHHRGIVKRWIHAIESLGLKVKP